MPLTLAIFNEEPVAADLKVTQFLNKQYNDSSLLPNKENTNEDALQMEVYTTDMYGSHQTLIGEGESAASVHKKVNRSYKYKSPRDNIKKAMRETVSRCSSSITSSSESRCSMDCISRCLRNMVITPTATAYERLSHSNNIIRHCSSPDLVYPNSSGHLQHSIYSSEDDSVNSSLPAVLEISQRDSFNNSGDSHSSKMYQHYIGQLQLSVVVKKKKQLDISVVQAKDLPSQTGGFSIQVQLTGGKKVKVLQTSSCAAGRNILCNLNCSLKLKKKYYQRRILIAVQSHDPACLGVVGCMSFGVQNIVNQKHIVRGWYFLLEESLGQSKHMQASSDMNPVLDDRSRLNSEGSANYPSSSSDTSGYSGSENNPLIQDSQMISNNMCFKPQNNASSADLQSEFIQIPVIKGVGGYGITLVEGCPTIISRVEHGSSAEAAGVRVGDCVMRINNQAVHTMYADAVGRVIRHNTQYIVLDILRPAQIGLRENQAFPSSCDLYEYGYDDDDTSDEDSDVCELDDDNEGDEEHYF